MKKRELGTSGIFVSELGFGAMSLPNDVQIANNIFDAALDAGMNFFDTADLYAGGRNEELVSHLLKGRRNEIVLATKVGNKWSPDGKSWTWHSSKKYIIETVKDSLHRLGTDYIDLYQLHGGQMEDDVDETIDAFESLKKEGVILQYGISSIRPNVIQRFLDRSSAISVMMQYSPLDRRPEEWFSMIAEHGASIIARGPIAKGFLTTKGTKQEKFAKFPPYTEQDLLQTVTELRERIDDLHATTLHYVLNEKSVATALVGASSTEQLLDSIRAYDKGASDDTIQLIRELTTEHKYEEHRLD